MFCILIDDDAIFNYIHEKTLRNLCPECQIKSFLSSRQALEFVVQNYSENPECIMSVFLDINMPEFNGFEFLDKLLAKIPDFMSVHSIFILTSSLNEKDKKKAAMYPELKGYLEKPLNKEQLEEILD
ncbi:MAG: hypothetical protein RL607_1192 [Bacteroidota bacterium]|jgi:CheY-like chemotaxis protein